MKQLDNIRMEKLDSGLDHSLEYRTIKSPAGEPGYAENDGLWVWDDEQSIGVHIWLGHSGAQYPDALERITVFLPDGRLLVKREQGRQITNESPAGPGLVVRCEKAFERWIEVFLLEKAIYEIGYELNQRPDWIGIPLSGLVSILER